MLLADLNHRPDNTLEDFKSVLEEICSYLPEVKATLRPYLSPELKDFKLLSPARKESAITDARHYLNSLKPFAASSDMERSEPLADHGQSLWLALRYFGLRPTSDVFEKLSSGNAIELYNSEGIQIWRNVSFLKICSYSLEEMFCYTWQERYARNEEATAKTVQVLSQLSVDSPKTIRCAVQNSLVELFRENDYR